MIYRWGFESSSVFCLVRTEYGMRALTIKRFAGAFSLYTSSFSSTNLVKKNFATLRSLSYHWSTLALHVSFRFRRLPLSTPWSTLQHRGAKVLGSDVRVGDVVQKKDRVYQVLKAQHTQQGRGGASIQVELRDINTGNKTTERFRTDEALESVFVEEKHYSYLYSEGGNIILMEPDTYDQIEVSKDLLGKAALYLKEDMTVSLQLYDGKPMSASIPNRVTCAVTQVEELKKGTVSPMHYVRATLDNGITVDVPPFVVSGDQIVVKTVDNSYVTRAKE